MPQAATKKETSRKAVSIYWDLEQLAQFFLTTENAEGTEEYSGKFKIKIFLAFLSPPINRDSEQLCGEKITAEAQWTQKNNL